MGSEAGRLGASGGPATTSLPLQDRAVLSHLLSALGAPGPQKLECSCHLLPPALLSVLDSGAGRVIGSACISSHPGAQRSPARRLQSLEFTHLPWIKAATLGKGEIDFPAPG